MVNTTLQTVLEDFRRIANIPDEIFVDNLLQLGRSAYFNGRIGDAVTIWAVAWKYGNQDAFECFRMFVK